MQTLLPHAGVRGQRPILDPSAAFYAATIFPYDLGYGKHRANTSARVNASVFSLCHPVRAGRHRAPRFSQRHRSQQLFPRRSQLLDRTAHSLFNDTANLGKAPLFHQTFSGRIIHQQRDLLALFSVQPAATSNDRLFRHLVYPSIQHSRRPH